MNTGVKAIGRIAFAAAVMMLFVGCIEIASEITIRDDSSGVITTTVVMERAILDTGYRLSDAELVPEPLQRSYLEDTLSRTEGVRLDEYTSRITQEHVEVTLTTAFANESGLRRLLELQGLALTDLHTNGISLAIAPDSYPVDSQESVEVGPMVRDLADAIQLRLHVQAPADIVAVAGLPAEYSGSRVSARIELLPLLASSDPTGLEVNW